MKLTLARVPVLICAFALFVLAGCSSNPMVGTWKLQVDDKADAATNQMASAVNMSVTFKADNTYEAEITLMGQKSTSTGKYKLDGKSLTMTSQVEDGKPVTTPKDEVITLSDDMKSFDMPNSNGMAKIVKQ